MEYSDFVKAYERFLVEDKPVPIRASDENVETIYETDWVQILLVREIPTDAEVKLVVEVSFPTWMQTLSLTSSTTEVEGDHTSRLRSVLHDLILHLEYLLKLSEAGFRLGVIVEEGFWTAWAPLSTRPSQQLFTALFSINPP
ncbi:MAG: hypothetical protein Q6361_00695 [Candidatus Hermodarchaeota archaeon]|nr:hypothetical protein [Candidatus Hermodarchaeota archaeon]